MDKHNSTKLSTKERFGVFQMTSGHFITENVPDDWEAMEERDQDDFLRDCAWQPFESWLGADIHTEIQNAADATCDYIENNLIGRAG